MKKQRIKVLIIAITRGGARFQDFRNRKGRKNENMVREGRVRGENMDVGRGIVRGKDRRGVKD